MVSKCVMAALLPMFAACSPNIIPQDIEVAEQLCESQGGILWFDVQHTGKRDTRTVKAGCKNTAIIEKNYKRTE